MSVTRINRGPAREFVPPGERSPDAVQVQRIETHMHEAFSRVADALFMNGVTVTGLPDTASFGGKTNGIAFTAAQIRDVPHNLGREASGFLVIDSTGNPPWLVRLTTGLDAGLKKTHIRLQHDPASVFGTSTTVKLWVW